MLGSPANYMTYYSCFFLLNQFRLARSCPRHFTDPVPNSFDYLFLFVIKKEEHSACPAHSNSITGSKRQVDIPEESMPKTLKFQPFTKEEALVGIHNVCTHFQLFFFCTVIEHLISLGFMLSLYINSPQGVFPSTTEQFFDLLLSDGSNFMIEYRSSRKDTNIIVSTKVLL